MTCRPTSPAIACVAMKPLTLLGLCLPLTAFSLPPTLLPDFQERLDGLPNLSLSESLKVGTLTVGPRPQPNPEFREVVALRQVPDAVRRPRYVSKMPLLEPKVAVDPRMPIKTPNPEIDYKLILKEPDVATAP